MLEQIVFGWVGYCEILFKNFIFDTYENIYFLDNQVVVHNDVHIIGSTLWSYVDEKDPARKYPINDYNYIKNL